MTLLEKMAKSHQRSEWEYVKSAHAAFDGIEVCNCLIFLKKELYAGEAVSANHPWSQTGNSILETPGGWLVWVNRSRAYWVAVTLT